MLYLITNGHRNDAKFFHVKRHHNLLLQFLMPDIFGWCLIFTEKPLTCSHKFLLISLSHDDDLFEPTKDENCNIHEQQDEKKLYRD